MTLGTTELSLVASTIRGLAMDAIQKADSGHPGLPMGMADAAAVLWTDCLRWSAEDPQWPGRDRFVLSAGHGSMLLYSLLHLAGFPVTIDDLRRFRQLHSKTPGHPEYGETPGVETTTGPLGQGFGNAVGMAIAAQMEAARFQNPLLRTRVFVLCGDGDLMEGISYEAGALAGHLQLGNLICLFDDNGITIEGRARLATSEDVAQRFAAQGWAVQTVDGHDHAQVRAALATATAPADRPQLICCRTVIAKGSPNKANSHEAHGAPLGTAEVAATKQALGLPAADFHVDPRAREPFARAARRNEELRRQWRDGIQDWAASHPDLAAAWRTFRSRAVPADLFEHLLAAAGPEPAATRASSGNVIQKAAELLPGLVGGSADLEPSTRTRMRQSPSFTATDRTGRNLHFGIREHAMGAILNGLSLHGGFLPLGSTFLVFADYMRTPMRLAALMKIPAVFVFTHDSLMVGEDGPTHQPVEHLATLRAIPDLHVFRPADGAETAAAWTHALARRDGPVAMALSRQNLPRLPRGPGWQPREVLRGGYVLRDAPGAKATLVATGAEVSLAVEAAALLAPRGVPARVVSMPCVELFLQQDPAWQHAVLGDAAVFTLEMGRPEAWCRFTGRIDRCIGLTAFGRSAPCKVLAEHFGFVAAQVAARVEAAL
ncbi:MAG: transketolase [Planctomycetes bacterium]|nr:transketolase [Planctomycetota bacterium]